MSRIKATIKSNLMSEDASSEGVEAKIPYGHDGGVLEHVSAVQKEKDAPLGRKKTELSEHSME